MPANLSLGLKRGTVRVVPHDPSWVELFAREYKLLKRLAGEHFVAMEHIGSTSIPGIHAKPIVDMQLAVRSLRDIARFREALEALGYSYRENGSDEMRVLFVKGPEELRTHHLHITEHGSDAWQVAILFRNHLRANSRVAREYNRLKMDLAVRHASDRAAYSAFKKGFIENIANELRRRA